MKRELVYLIIASLFGALMAFADTAVVPVSVTSTVAGDAGSSVNFLISDNSAISGHSLHTTNNVAVVLHTGDTLDLTNIVAYHASNGHKESWTHVKTSIGNPIFIFDLGADITIDSTILWQYGNWAGQLPKAGENDVKDFSLIFHTEAQGTNFTFATEATTTNTAIRMQNLDPNGNLAQQFTFPSTTVRYIAMRIDSTFGGPRYGLGEVTFATSGGSETPPSPPILVISETNIQFNSKSNHVYTLLATSNLTDSASWKLITNVTARSDSTTIDITKTNAVEFYKVTTE